MQIYKREIAFHEMSEKENICGPREVEEKFLGNCHYYL